MPLPARACLATFVALLATIAALLLAAPRAHALGGIDQTAACVDSAYRTWGAQTGRLDVMVFIQDMRGCAEGYVSTMKNPARTTELYQCLRRAGAAYMPIGGWEPAFAKAVTCVEQYTGLEFYTP
jgi:hypothetical protein